MTQSLPLFTTQTKSQAQIRDDILRTLKNHMILVLGIPNPNVGESSDYWGIASGVANEICVGLSNGIISTDNQMPDRAGGTFLDRWLALFGLSRAGASQSAGVVTPTYSLTQGYTFVPTGAVLLDSVGLRYQVTVGGNYGPGNSGIGQPANITIPVQSVDTGSATDHANGDTLTWVSGVAFVANNVSVGTLGGTDGLAGGNNSEATDDEAPRARLLDRLQNPPGGGNWADVTRWVKDSSPDVQVGFCYPALLGPGTMFFVAIGAAQTKGTLSSTSKNRDLPATLMTGTVIPYVQGKYPTRAAVIGATAVNQPTDVALLLSLPSAQTASPAGPGGGWVDGTPWPSTGFVATGSYTAATVTAIVTSVTFQVQISGVMPGPTVGVSHVAYLDPTNWQLYTATVVAAVAIGGGVWTITIDTPWPNVYVGAMIFPQAVQQDNYIAAMLQGFANLGPGEWTVNGQILKRAFRHPSSSITWPASLDANYLRTVENSGNEVANAQFIFRSSTTPTVPTAVTITTLDPLLLTSAAPNILVPRSLAFYQS